MSSDGDHVVFQNSINDNLADSSNVIFNDKNYTFITDSTSNSGSFSSGQIQFDLATLNSQSQWINLKEAIVEFPVKITAKLTTALSGTTPTLTKCLASTAIIKNGWHQWIDGTQLIINGQTIKSTQPFNNVEASFRILSTWSQDCLKKNGVSCGIALDDCTGDQATTTSNTVGLSNATYSTMAANIKGFDAINNQTMTLNKGICARNSFTNNDVNPTDANLQTSILGAAAMKTAGRNNVASTLAGLNTINTSIYSAYYMATVRLCDLIDFDEFPLVKNLKGFLYLTFNSSQVTLTGPTLINSDLITGVSVVLLNGRTTPFLINNSTAGLTFGQTPTSITATPVLQITGSVDGTTTDAISPAGPLLTSARLLVPFYVANPKSDSALSIPSKFFTTLETLVNPITCTAGSSVNYTISVGVQNPRKLILLPMWQNLGGVTNLTNPEISPFDTVPATSGVFAQLNNLQVYLGNKPIYQYPIQYDFEQWCMENNSLGLNGDTINEMTSGLLSQQLFEQNHRFYYVDLSRRMDSEDGASKSVQVSFSNPSAGFGLKVIAIVFYEKRWVISTSTCSLSAV